jgi:hypothetical protein
MKRFQMDRPVMVKRWRKEWEAHGRDFGNCHCGRGMGTMRKHRPFEGHGRKCGICGLEQALARQERRRIRYGARRWIAEGLADLNGEGL